MIKIVNGIEIELTEEEITELQAQALLASAREAAEAYIIQRQLAYASFGEQLDKIYHDIDNECLDKTGEFYLHCKSVKDSIPKPEEE